MTRQLRLGNNLVNLLGIRLITLLLQVAVAVVAVRAVEVVLAGYCHLA
jgi:hypothetical protein